MDKKEIEFQKRIQATFRIEAEEHLRAISAGLLVLEKSQSEKEKAELIEVLFREVHSLKGAARSVDQKEIEYVCQPMESIFSDLKCKAIALTPSSINLFFKTVEWLLKHVATSGDDQTGAFRQNQKDLIRQLKEMASEKPVAETIQKTAPADTKPPSPEKSDPIPEHVSSDIIARDNIPAQIEMVRIAVSKLDPLLMQAEELTQSKKVLDERADELQKLCDEVTEWKNETQKWRSRKSVPSGIVWNEWYDNCEVRLNKVLTQLEEITRFLERDQHSFERLVNNHLDAMKQVLMLPVGSMVESFPGMVREISQKQNKEIDFIIRGMELEIDKRILEELKEPLIHLIRNSIDHGISKPGERILQNKQIRGNITLAFVSKENGQVEVTVSDDGIGIDKELILKAAIKSGVISNEVASKLALKDVLNLIYQSGVSTSSIITEISGRGLGLPIVREKVEKLNGRISLESETNQGTTFRILLPMTLATFRGIVVKVKDSLFIMPTLNIERVLKVEQEEIKTVETQETLHIDDQIISLVDLRKVLGLSEHKYSRSGNMETGTVNPTKICVVVIVYGEQRIAFKVDEIVDEQQVLVKGLGKLLNRVPNISGATILGSGQVVPVLNIKDLMKSAVKVKGKKDKARADDILIPKTGKILVVEDSITSRTLLKNILETAGYQVTTSVDGAEALTKIRAGDFDIIVSDVDMPKMNGFELTLKIKSDKKLSEIPVVLVTSLESRDDRERGIEVGADAYLIKSSFDQTSLLEIIKKLI
jgi:two-component system chemotaxis sensor kinase CheA